LEPALRRPPRNPFSSRPSRPPCRRPPRSSPWHRRFSVGIVPVNTRSCRPKHRPGLPLRLAFRPVHAGIQQSSMTSRLCDSLKKPQAGGYDGGVGHLLQGCSIRIPYAIEIAKMAWPDRGPWPRRHCGCPAQR
jgi:hypothetical protein